MKKKLLFKDISTFLYAFALAMFQFTIFELVLTNKTVVEYRMNFTVGALIGILLICIATVLYMSERFRKLREFVLDTKLNRYSTVFGLVSLIILVFIYLNKTMFYLDIITIIILIIASLLIGRILEKTK